MATNWPQQVFVRDTVEGTTTLVSVDNNGVKGSGGNSTVPALSADGRYVAFVSDAPNLVPGDTNVDIDIFLRDTVAGTTTRVSVDSAEAEADDDSFDADISARLVPIVGTNLVPGDTNGVPTRRARPGRTSTATRPSRPLSRPMVATLRSCRRRRTSSPVIPTALPMSSCGTCRPAPRAA